MKKFLIAISICALLFVVLFVLKSFTTYSPSQSTIHPEPSSIVSPEPTEFFPATKVSQDKEFTKDWKTFRSDYYGYSFKYPNTWHLQSTISKTPPYEEEITQLTSVKHPINQKPYFCLDIRGGPFNTTQESAIARMPFKSEVFTTPHNQKLSIFTIGEKEGTMSNRLNLIQNNSYIIKTKSGKFIEIYGEFNCIQGDNELLNSSTEAFEDRPEVRTAKEILKSIDFDL